jgi:hypothetical protein
LRHEGQKLVERVLEFIRPHAFAIAEQALEFKKLVFVFFKIVIGKLKIQRGCANRGINDLKNVFFALVNARLTRGSAIAVSARQERQSKHHNTQKQSNYFDRTFHPSPPSYFAKSIIPQAHALFNMESIYQPMVEKQAEAPLLHI